MSDINPTQPSGSIGKAQSAWMRKTQIIFGVVVMVIFVLILIARTMTASDLPDCDSKLAKDALSDIFKRGKLEFSRYIEIKTLNKTENEITCFASLAKSAGGSAEFDYRIYLENKAPMVQVTRGVDKP
jgi:hypothetical protein